MRFVREDFSLLFLRIAVSGMMLMHGIGKLKDPTSFVNLVEMSLNLGSASLPLAYISILAETLFPFLIILGILVRISALISATNMLVATFLFHIAVKGDPFFAWEKAALYSVVFLFLSMVGGGRYSILNVKGE
ncbi:MAG: DoxX family protein [Thermotogae bacterium]|nr:DoxX family protein [Thermotogota bacterium]